MPASGNEFPRSGAPSSFVGRDAERVQVERLVRDHRLVTVAGPGGSGKSRLASHLVEERFGRSFDEVWWVELAEISDPAFLVARIATSTGVHTDPAADLRTQLVGLLADRSALLVLDNSEHLAEEVADLLGGLLRAGQGVRVLATSRRPLGVDGEVVWAIPSLEVPAETDGGDDPLALESVASARLFLDRARSVRPGLVVDGEAAAHVAHICRHLDGLPLALELAAARVRSMEIRRLREQLDEAMDLLSGTGARRLPSRQRTMMASIAWSESLLSGDERLVLRRLAVFVGDFALDDAMPVVSGAGLSTRRVFDAFDGLVAQSLLLFEEVPAGPARYRLHEVIRQYAERRLHQAGEYDDLRRRHAEQYALRAADLGALLQRGWDDRAFAWLAADTGNLAAAMRLFCEHAEAARAVDLFWDTQHVWGAVSPALASELAQRILGQRSQLPDGALARLYAASAVVRADAGALAAASADAEAALALTTEADEPSVHRRARLYHEAIASISDPARAEAELRQAVERCAAAGDETATIFGRFWLAACVALFQGEIARGMRLLAEQTGDDAAQDHPVRAAGVHALLAEAFIERGEIPEALAHVRATEEQIDRVAGLLRDGAPRFRAMSIPGSMAAAVRGYAAVLQDTSPLPGRDLAAESRRSAARGHWLAAYFYGFLGALESMMRSRPEPARAELTALLPLAASMGSWFTTNMHLVGAVVALGEGDPEAADEWLGLLDAEAITTPVLRARRAVVQANLALCRGDPGGAEQVAWQHLPSVMAEQVALETTQLIELLARAAAAKGRTPQAVVLAAAASRVRQDKGLVLGPPGHILPFQRDLDAVRRAVGPDAFAAAWRQGEGLSLDEAAAYAARMRPPRGRRTSGWDSLTPAEREVVALVSQGMTNPQIGERLLMSRETVKTHLRHVFAKLDVHSRAHLAALAQRRPRGPS
ncbi:MAG TPA: LuxR C-terminal-related transcriptional regulator [Arachnia sp.]|nr:LuxR C-terminal-related transcriptional regulator [Arachnia sp.]HMT85487.1 LuxR C-terminal-related transcriptional regulator [Arachnia sp.]